MAVSNCCQKTDEAYTKMNSCCICKIESGSHLFHISKDEHFCVECGKVCETANSLLTIKTFSESCSDSVVLQQHILCFGVANEKLPYWLQCTNSKCQTWHEVRTSEVISPGFIEEFQCKSTEEKVTPCVVNIKSTEWEEWYKADSTGAFIHENNEKCQSKSIEKCHANICAENVKCLEWIQELKYAPLLKFSHIAQYINGVPPEEAGFYPPQSPKALFCKCPNWVVPFANALNDGSSIWVCPNVMEDLEYEEFCTALNWKDPSTGDESSTWITKKTKRLLFLGLRNLLVILWNLSPQEWLSAEKVNIYLICRGLIRIYLLSHIDRIIWLLTKKGIINYGLVCSPTLTSPSSTNHPVIVVGAGIAGLAAANHLSKLGIKTVIIEASKRVGGRINCGEKECYGSEFIEGLINNPLTILGHQAKFQLEEINSDPVFVDEKSVVPIIVAIRMLCHFGSMMRYALNKAKSAKDSNWLDTIMEDQNFYKKVEDFSAVDEQIFDFMLKFTEIECRTVCKELTLKHFELPKKLGANGHVLQGLPLLIDKLAEGLDIYYGMKVCEINYTDNEIEVITTGEISETFKASKVIVTVPLPVLSNGIKFYPPLPDYKLKAIRQMGNVIQEKIVMQFPKRFWAPVLSDETLKFGIISSKKLPFQYFIDVSNLLQVYQPTLVTFITDCNKDLLDKKDEEIIEICLITLKEAFSKLHIDVPSPKTWTITHWSNDPLCGTSGSFVKVGSSYELYDQIAKPIGETIFFAGEATFRNCPNSATGAFLSGLREAANIAVLENI